MYDKALLILQRSVFSRSMSLLQYWKHDFSSYTLLYYVIRITTTVVQIYPLQSMLMWVQVQNLAKKVNIVILYNLFSAIEITSSSKRVWPGIMSNYPYVVGLVILAAIAYGVRDWFQIELYTSVSGGVMISFWW